MMKLTPIIETSRPEPWRECSGCGEPAIVKVAIGAQLNSSHSSSMSFGLCESCRALTIRTLATETRKS